MSTPKVTKLFRLDLDMHYWIEAQAGYRRVSQAQVVRDLILEAMREEPLPETPEKGGRE